MLRLTVLVALLALPLGARFASATQRLGPLELSGNLQSQNLIRHPDVSRYQLVQNRNTLHVHFDYDWMRGGKFIDRYYLPFIETSKLFIIYRGVYDSIYDTTPDTLSKLDIKGRAYEVAGQRVDIFDYARQAGDAFGNKGAKATKWLKLSSLTNGQSDALKFDNQLREAYIDLKMRGIPLSIRAGRQQVVWGETDNFRMLDRANSLDLTWHLQQEIPPPALGWDEIRRPFWMLKFLYDLGDVWKLSQNFLEWYWNPGDWYPAKQSFYPRPWGLPFLDPLANPINGAFYSGACESSPFKYRNAGGRMAGRCMSLLNGTRLFEHGDYARNPLENSQVGVRYHGIMPFGMEFTLNYYYQRWSGDDGTNYAPLKGLPNTKEGKAIANTALKHGQFPAVAYMPYVHTIGASANYSDEAFTQAVFRFETVYDVGVPFFDVAGSRITFVDGLLPGVRSKNMWKGMIAFDRPTWIRPLNKKSTWFLTGQFFWHYLVNNPKCDEHEVANLSNTDPDQGGPLKSPRSQAPSCLVGGLDLPALPGKDKTLSFNDKIRTWETLFTFAAFSFYRGGSIVPVLGFAVDPTNSWNLEGFWNVDFVATDNLVVNIGQRYFVTPYGRSTPVFETWGIAGLNGGRSETALRLSYQF